jgi:hypothetical protein
MRVKQGPIENPDEKCWDENDGADPDPELRAENDDELEGVLGAI